jgi:glycerol-3-phosphate acyltransferase PlsY
VRAGWIGFLLGAAVGSVPFAWLVHRLATGRDLRAEGSGNPGAANVQRTIGVGWGAVAAALDVGKGALAVWLAVRWVGAAGGVAAAVGAVVGHIVSPWLGGRGGRGVAPAAGAFAVLAPAATGLAAMVFALAVAATRWVSLGSLLAAAVLPAAILLMGPGRKAAVAAAAVALAIAWRHRGNFERMRAGTEPRVRWRGSSGRSGRR